MDISADIAYLKAQLDGIKDPSFIAKLKALIDSKLKKKEKTTSSFAPLYGILNKKEADEFEKIIEEGCEQIDEHEW